MATDRLIGCEQVSVTLGGRLVLEGVSLAVHRGESIGIVGPNGGGKTTLMRVLTLLLEPSSGRMSMAAGLRIGYVSQRLAQPDGNFPASVFDVVDMGLAQQLHGKRQKELVRAALETVGMAHAASQRFSSLSGGQAQRVLIAKAIAAHPDILILDEPTAGIDGKSQRAFEVLVRRLNAEGMTIILVSHDPQELMHSGVHRIIHVNQRIRFDGPIAAYRQHPEHLSHHGQTPAEHGHHGGTR